MSKVICEFYEQCSNTICNWHSPFEDSNFEWTKQLGECDEQFVKFDHLGFVGFIQYKNE